MSLFACKARGDKCAHDLHCKLDSYDARAETEHVAVIMLARLVSRVGVAAERSAHAAQFVRSHICAHAATADDYAYLSRATLYGLADCERIVWIIIRHASIMRAEILYLMPACAQLFNHALVQRKAPMICADGYSHDETLSLSFAG